MRSYSRQPMALRRRFWVALATACLCLAQTGWGGRIRLDNGRELHGVIESISEQHVVIRVGGGRIRLDRNRITDIERSDPAERERLLNEWQRHHFLAPRFVPDGLDGLATGLRRLLRQRDGLASVMQTMREQVAQEQILLPAVEQMQRDIARTNRQLADADPERDPADYNRRVAAANQAGVAWRTHQREIDTIRQAIAEQQTHLNAYMRRFDQLVQQTREAAHDSTPSRHVFLEAMNERLDDLRRDFVEVAIQTTAQGSVAVISARINDRRDGRFIVDTGAGVVTLSADFAQRAGIPAPLPGAPTVTVVTADGRTVEAHPVMLESLHVTGYTERHVAAVVLPDPPGDGVDGLLGMSFLRRFHVSLAPSGELILRRMTNP